MLTSNSQSVPLTLLIGGVFGVRR